MLSAHKRALEKVEKLFSTLPSPQKAWVQNYFNHLVTRQYSYNTVLTSAYSLNQFLRFLEGDKPFSEIQKRDIREFSNDLSDQGLSPSTINVRLSSLNSFFTFLMDEDQISRNPVLKRYYVPGDTHLPRPMSMEDLRIFLHALKTQHPRDKALFLLMVRTGLRISEALRVRQEDLNWRQCNLIVYNGKGKVDRVVYFSADVTHAMKAWLTKRLVSSPYCFTHLKKPYEPMVSNKHALHRMAQILEECGLGEKGYGLHTLRHTYATTLLNAGVPLETLKELMGHKKLDHTLRYTQLSNRKIHNSYQQAIEQIEEELNQPAEEYELSQVL